MLYLQYNQMVHSKWLDQNRRLCDNISLILILIMAIGREINFVWGHFSFNSLSKNQ